ncbi:MAG: MFS transporter [Archangium gephyra]|uniref:MFS transporter n=1 Tax=Archangium gephyra TaxID=48 RepID=A0A2W5TTZ3_9BACT|nr:MAG: MFS transporter [Archangium gephyra]
MNRVPAVWKIGVLTVLYGAQGLPFGFQSNALPLYLGELKLSYTQIGLARALALPWALKAIWAPLVDRYGTRKRWIISAQALLTLTCVAAAFFPLDESTLVPFLACVLLMNLFAATQDIAVDGLAVDLLEPRELGAGNAAQVVGYKFGILTGGSLLVVLSAAYGWKWLFLSMAALCVIAMTVVMFVDEPRHAATEKKERVSWREIVSKVKSIVTRSGAGWLLFAVATYKLGETLADAMFGVWLTRVHEIPKQQVALWLGGWGMAASVIGSFLGGLLATRTRIVTAVFIAACLRLIPLAAQWAAVAGLFGISRDTIIPLTMAEHCFGGLLTTTMFALMMASVDRSIGATHFTLLASIEVAGKAVPGLLSGVFVDHFGFSATFGIAVALSGFFLFVCRRLSQPVQPGSEPAP